MKEAISKAMKDPFGPVRVLLATQAYGMGADAPNIRSIIHIGPASTVEGIILIDFLICRFTKCQTQMIRKQIPFFPRQIDD